MRLVCVCGGGGGVSIDGVVKVCGGWVAGGCCSNNLGLLLLWLECGPL